MNVILRPAVRRLEQAALVGARSGARGCANAAAAAASGEGQRRRLWRWGATEGGAMSRNAVCEVSKEPTLMDDVHGVSTGACGSNHSAFVVGGKLYTYGSNKYHQLGRKAGAEAEEGAGSPPAPVVIEASDGHRPSVRAVSLGAFHSAAITEGGALWTWGWGGSFWHGAGALGQGTRDTEEVPALVTRFVEQGEEVVQVACGSQHTVVLTNEGRLYSTGKGEFGRLGRGDTSDELDFEEIEYFTQSNDSILNPNDQTTIVKIGAGENFSAALSSNGELWVWGRNDYGQLGLGEEAMGDMYSAERYPRLVRSLPVEGHTIADFACGEHHLVVLTHSGAIYEWGNRLWLEPHPVTLPSRYAEGLKDIVKVAAGDKFSYALTAEGRLYSWGAKASGCLAQGPDCPKNVVQPTAIAPETFGRQRVLDIIAAKRRCLAITAEDELIE
eukprot:TRINITY_DN45302_c0_g1_i1.p1 TRINITY_DN45302_c0_g1~~TRINITY_DN45302_c0_g1_i1.p1  ORF type:complete len:464 (+),score=109.26 TRINITY_DN45302_c0_g1_i1:68-1393(+)